MPAGDALDSLESEQPLLEAERWRPRPERSWTTSVPGRSPCRNGDGNQQVTGCRRSSDRQVGPRSHVGVRQYNCADEGGRGRCVDVVVQDHASSAAVVRAGVHTDLADGMQQAHRQPAAGIHVTADRTSEGVATLFSRQPAENECVGVRHDLVERIGPAADDHEQTREPHAPQLARTSLPTSCVPSARRCRSRSPLSPSALPDHHVVSFEVPASR